MYAQYIQIKIQFFFFSHTILRRWPILTGKRLVVERERDAIVNQDERNDGIMTPPPFPTTHPFRVFVFTSFFCFLLIVTKLVTFFLSLCVLRR